MAAIEAVKASDARTGAIENLDCLCCGAATQHTYRFTVNHCPIWQCRQCGLGRAEAAGFAPSAYYTAEYFSGQHSDGYADYLGAEPVLRREFAHTVSFIRRFVPSGRLLDVGCAYGFFLQEARRYFDVHGIEIAEDAAKHCGKSGLDVSTGIADANTLAAFGELDVITLFDVIEHLPKPDETLALCNRHLRPGGILVLTTGDFGSVFAKMLGPKWRLMTPPQHLWFFTRESIGRLANQLGFTMLRFEHPAKVVPLSLIAFQLRRMLGLQIKPPNSVSALGIPVNLFDAMRVVLQKRAA
jgi:2-polyprenyl-3-methyl-5-hydroxy-6-metoxy-1,4-benzoquinol methylase